MPKSGLVPVKKQIRAKHPYTAVRYVSIAPKETKRRIKEYLSGRKKASKTTKYLKKHPLDVEIFTAAELKTVVQPDAKGRKKFARYDLELVKNVFIFKKPEELGGITAAVFLNDGSRHFEHRDKETANNAKKKFVRAKNVGVSRHKFQERYRNLLKGEKKNKNRQLGAVLALMDQFDIRVGSGVYGVNEEVLKPDQLKRGMVISHSSWPVGTLPHVVVEEVTEDGPKKLFLRSITKDEEIKELGAYRRKIKSLRKGLAKKPDDAKQEELNTLERKEKELSAKILIPFPSNWKEVIKLGHYGATQIEARHVKYPKPGEVWLDFIGKSGKRWLRKIEDPDLKNAITDLQKGKSDKDQIFPDVDRGDTAVELKKFKLLPKDLRTFDGTSTFIEVAKNFPPPTTEKELKQAEKEIFKLVGKKLGNLPGTAKKAYVNPPVYTAWYSGLLQEILKKKGEVKKSLMFIITLPTKRTSFDLSDLRSGGVR
jgi:DNA topoisomerase IB